MFLGDTSYSGKYTASLSMEGRWGGGGGGGGGGAGVGIRMVRYTGRKILNNFIMLV